MRRARIAATFGRSVRANETNPASQREGREPLSISNKRDSSLQRYSIKIVALPSLIPDFAIDKPRLPDSRDNTGIVVVRITAKRVQMVGSAPKVTDENDLRHKGSFGGGGCLIKICEAWPRRGAVAATACLEITRCKVVGLYGFVI